MTFSEAYSTITRPGSDGLLEWIQTTDFFTAPASTRYHDSHQGGLVAHSVKVYEELLRLTRAYPEREFAPQSIAIVALLHDLCKIDCYKTEMRNKKDDFGRWQQVPYYTFDEDFCFGGHGSKSVYLIQRYMPLTHEEAVAINCHMGASQGDSSVYDAYRAYPLAFLLHTADMAATINF